MGIAWSVSEALLAAGAPTLFATHFAQLSELAALYPAAKAWHFDVGDVAGRRALDFSWRLRAGCCEVERYGLLLASAVGFPEEVLATAEEVVAGETWAGAERRALSSSRACARGFRWLTIPLLWPTCSCLFCPLQPFVSQSEPVILTDPCSAGRG